MTQRLRNKKIFLLLLVFFIIIFLFFYFCVHGEPVDKEIEKIKIRDILVEVELASSPDEHYLGLSHRDFLLEKSGMLFLFQEEEEISFLMRDMNFSLDILFINKNKIVNIYKNIPFDKNSQSILYKSIYPVDKVLELNGGFCDENKIKVGDFLEFL